MRVRRAIVFVALLACIAALAAAIAIVARRGSAPSRELATALADFRAKPSQAAVDGLIELFDDEGLTREQRDLILREILKPTIITRASYSTERRTTIRAAVPWKIELKHAKCHWLIRILAANEQSGDRDSSWGLPIYWLSCGKAADGTVSDLNRPGDYSVIVSVDYRVYPIVRKTRWIWGGTQPTKPRFALPRRIFTEDVSYADAYRGIINVLVPIKMAASADAEEVVLKTDPDLDKRMKEAFQPEAVADQEVARRRTGPSAYGAYAAGIPIVVSGMPRIVCSQAPENVAFTYYFVDRSGSKAEPDTRLRSEYLIRAGKTGVMTVREDFYARLGYRNGTYEGKLVFVPDLKLAYADPEVKSIWGGTLEFPVTFKIYDRKE